MNRERAIGLIGRLRDRLDRPLPDGVVDELARGVNGHVVRLMIWALGVAQDDMRAVDNFEKSIKAP